MNVHCMQLKLIVQPGTMSRTYTLKQVMTEKAMKKLNMKFNLENTAKSLLRKQKKNKYDRQIPRRTGELQAP